MKIVAISDMHGLQEYVHINECDILCICGDIVPLKMQRNIPQSMSWFKKQFIPWCEKQPCKQIYLVAGNHDFFMENNDKELNEILMGTKIIYLNNQSAEYLDEESGKTYSIWGSPLCHIFGNWAFMYSPEYELEKFSLMPKNFGLSALIPFTVEYVISFIKKLSVIIFTESCYLANSGF